MKLQIDVDGVLADFMGGASNLAHKLDPTLPQVDTYTTKDWDNWEGWPKQVVDDLWKEIKRSDALFFYGLKSLIDKETWRNLAKLMIPKNEVYFVTSRPGKTSKWQTETWLFDRLERQATVVITSDKAGFAKLVKPDFAVEDNVMNAYKIGQVIGANKSYIVDRLYNQNLHPMSAVRVKSFKEFLEKINA